MDALGAKGPHPDLSASLGLFGSSWARGLSDVVSEDQVVLAQGTVHGTAPGRLYGAPATKRPFQANLFDLVVAEDGQIVERFQQTDVLGQMGQLYGRALGLVGLGAVLWRL